MQWIIGGLILAAWFFSIEPVFAQSKASLVFPDALCIDGDRWTDNVSKDPNITSFIQGRGVTESGQEVLWQRYEMNNNTWGLMWSGDQGKTWCKLAAGEGPWINILGTGT